MKKIPPSNKKKRKGKNPRCQWKKRSHNLKKKRKNPLNNHPEKDLLNKSRKKVYKERKLKENNPPLQKRKNQNQSKPKANQRRERSFKKTPLMMKVNLNKERKLLVPSWPPKNLQKLRRLNRNNPHQMKMIHKNSKIQRKKWWYQR